MSERSSNGRFGRGDSINRRKILQSMGTATATGIVGTGIVSGGRSNTQYFTGISYDTLTHVPQGKANAEITQANGGIKGRLHVGGFNVPIGQKEPLVADANSSEYLVKKHGSQFSKEGLPLKIRFQPIGDNIIGTATYPGGDFGTLGFTLKSSERGSAVQTIKRGLMNRGNGVAPKGYEKVPSIRSEGVPENTGFRKIVKRGKN